MAAEEGNNSQDAVQDMNLLAKPGSPADSIDPSLAWAKDTLTTPTRLSTEGKRSASDPARTEAEKDESDADELTGPVKEVHRRLRSQSSVDPTTINRKINFGMIETTIPCSTLTHTTECKELSPDNMTRNEIIRDSQSAEELSVRTELPSMMLPSTLTEDGGHSEDSKPKSNLTSGTPDTRADYHLDRSSSIMHPVPHPDGPHVGSPSPLTTLPPAAPYHVANELMYNYNNGALNHGPHPRGATAKEFAQPSVPPLLQTPSSRTVAGNQADVDPTPYSAASLDALQYDLDRTRERNNLLDQLVIEYRRMHGFDLTRYPAEVAQRALLQAQLGATSQSRAIQNWVDTTRSNSQQPGVGNDGMTHAPLSHLRVIDRGGQIAIARVSATDDNGTWTETDAYPLPNHLTNPGPASQATSPLNHPSGGNFGLGTESSHATALPISVSDPRRETYICNHCRLQFFPNAENPLVLCPDCGFSSNIRYCSMACLRDAETQHSGHCQRYPVASRLFIENIPVPYG